MRFADRSRGINYGSDRVRFTAPVPAGSRVRLHQTLTKVEDIEGGVRMTFDSQMEIEGSSRPALDGRDAERHGPTEPRDVPDHPMSLTTRCP